MQAPFWAEVQAGGQKGEDGTVGDLESGGFCQPCAGTILFQYETLLKEELFFCYVLVRGNSKHMFLDLLN